MIKSLKMGQSTVKKKETNLAFGSKCLTRADPLGIKTSSGASSALAGQDRFSSLPKKHMTSTMQTFPTHRQSSDSDLSLFSEWSQLHTLRLLSPSRLRADKASPTVAEIERDLTGGFPRQRSETSCENRLSPMHCICI